jgi:hypothetical protein
MPAPILSVGAKVLCAHTGQATPTTPFPRVAVSGQLVVTVTSPYGVVGCALTGTPTPPCVTGQFVTGAVRVMAGGLPIAIMTGQSVCVPTGTPMTPAAAQTRVVAT